MRLCLFINIIRIEFQISSGDNCKFIFNGTCVLVVLETVLRISSTVICLNHIYQLPTIGERWLENISECKKACELIRV